MGNIHCVVWWAVTDTYIHQRYVLDLGKKYGDIEGHYFHYIYYITCNTQKNKFKILIRISHAIIKFTFFIKDFKKTKI